MRNTTRRWPLILAVSIPGLGMSMGSWACNERDMTGSTEEALLTFDAMPPPLDSSVDTAPPSDAGGLDAGSLDAGGLDAGDLDASDAAPDVITCQACCIDCGQTNCNGLCTDTNNDPGNCGFCGNACPMGATCDAGACACAPGQTQCNAGCVDTSSDPANCGDCDLVCAPGQACSAGTCAWTGGDAGTGEGGTGCGDPQTDPSNCGGCGNVCVAGASCVAGACVGGGCDGGQQSCHGGCADLESDEANCGGCGVTCAPGSSCVFGDCHQDDAGVTACAPPTQNCTDGGGLPAACADILSDTNNCGDCGTVCAPGQSCHLGVCAAP